jgi:hypothetical protein
LGHGYRLSTLRQHNRNRPPILDNGYSRILSSTPGSLGRQKLYGVPESVRRLRSVDEWLLSHELLNSWRWEDSDCPLVNHFLGYRAMNIYQLTSSRSIVVDYIQTRVMHDSSGLACIYCYCNYKDQKRQTVSELITSLLKQLVQHRPLILTNPFIIAAQLTTRVSKVSLYGLCLLDSRVFPTRQFS